MQKLIIFTFTAALFSLKAAYSQEVFKLGIKQPPTITITLPEVINASIGEVVNPDTWFHVEGGISYNRIWKFWDGSQLQTIDNPIYTITSNGVFYLTIINENGCTVIDSITLNIITGIEDINSDKNNQQSIQVYPNPNAGTFDITISDCQPGSSVEIINSLGVRFLNKPLECNNNEYSGMVMMPSGQSGTYYLLVKKDSKIIYRQKVIILK